MKRYLNFIGSTEKQKSEKASVSIAFMSLGYSGGALIGHLTIMRRKKMGQHKTNPVAIAAKNGEILPRTPRMSKADTDRLLYLHVKSVLAGRTGLPDYILNGLY